MRKLTILVIVASFLLGVPAYVVYAKKPDNPGNSGNAPGQSGDAPGQSGDSPGQSGNASGQGGTSPGKSGDAPGQQDPLPPPPPSEDIVTVAETASPLNPLSTSDESFLQTKDFINLAGGAQHNSESIGFATPFGGIIVSNSEEFEKVEHLIEVTILMYSSGLLTRDEARQMTVEALAEMKDATHEPKFLGMFHKCYSKNLFNGLGLLCR